MKPRVFDEPFYEQTCRDNFRTDVGPFHRAGELRRIDGYT
jgi:hypothetical protein